MIYSKPEYKTLTSEIDILSKKVQLAQEMGVPDNKAQRKKAAQNDAKLKTLNGRMQAMKMRSTFLIGLFLMVSISSLSNYFEGIPVARLPFVPLSFFQGLTHRGLGGDDFTECSFFFIYLMASYLFRTNIQKFFGFEGPKTKFNPFMPDLNQNYN